MYEALIAALAPDFWCLAPDTPGFGHSDPPAHGVSIAAYSAAIAAFLHALSIDTCYLFGHHTGAAIGVQLAFDRPGSVTSLALSGPPLLSAAQIAHLQTTLPMLEPSEDGRFLVDLWQRLRRKSRTAPLELTLRETIAAWQGRDSYHAAYHAVFAQDFGTQLAALTCPVLLLAGEHDSLRASLEPAAALLRNGRCRIIPNAGTYVCDEQPQSVAHLLRAFFEAA
jgi:pimeloyl-ACP methyl ester carboxylesterase